MIEAKQAPNVYVSFALRSKPAAEIVVRELSNTGFRVASGPLTSPESRAPSPSRFVPTGTPGVQPSIWSGEFTEHFRNTLRSADAFVIVTSSVDAGDPEMAYIFGAARVLDKPIFIVRADDGPLPDFMRMGDIQIVRLSELKKLVNAIRRIVPSRTEAKSHVG